MRYALRNAWLCGVAMWLVGAIGSSNAGAAFLVLAPSSGLSRAITNAASPSPTITYTPISGGFLIGMDGRFGGSSTDAILSFALPVLSPGETIVSAAIRVTTGFATPSVGSQLTFRGTLFGDPNPALATPADFALTSTTSFQGIFTLGQPVPTTYEFAATSALTLANPGIGVRLEALTAGGIDIQSVSLVLETRAVPEPSSLVMLGVAGIGAIGLVGRRRRMVGA